MKLRLWEPLLLVMVIAALALTLRPHPPAPSTISPEPTPLENEIPQPHPLPSWAPSPKPGQTLSPEAHLLLRTAYEDGPVAYVVFKEAGVYYGATVAAGRHEAHSRVIQLWIVDSKRGWIPTGFSIFVKDTPSPAELPAGIFDASEFPEAARKRLRAASWIDLY